MGHKRSSGASPWRRGLCQGWCRHLRCTDPHTFLPAPFSLPPCHREAQRGFPGSGAGAQDESSQAEGTASGELSREGDRLAGSRKEQVFFFLSAL